MTPEFLRKSGAANISRKPFGQAPEDERLRHGVHEVTLRARWGASLIYSALSISAPVDQQHSCCLGRSLRKNRARLRGQELAILGPFRFQRVQEVGRLLASIANPSNSQRQGRKAAANATLRLLGDSLEEASQQRIIEYWLEGDQRLSERRGPWARFLYESGAFLHVALEVKN